jgi:hypothetical protein
MEMMGFKVMFDQLPYLLPECFILVPGFKNSNFLPIVTSTDSPACDNVHPDFFFPDFTIKTL